MTLQQSYLRFLAAPSQSSLAGPSSTLTYVTTTSTITGDAIVAHLRKHASIVEKKSETVLSAIETENSLVLETEVTILFKTGGGEFLPGLDDNFIVDQEATFPLIHIVAFHNALITHARLYWDQATLLKQMGVIGRTGRNWPIRDGKEQSSSIRASVAKTTSSPNPEPFSAPAAPETPVKPPTSSRPDADDRTNNSIAASHARRDVAHFTLADHSPAGNGAEPQIYKTSGDGMGGRRVPIDDDNNNKRGGSGPTVFTGKSRRQQMEDDFYAAREVEEVREQVELLGDKGRTIYKTRGDGMGGRKGGDEWRGY